MARYCCVPNMILKMCGSKGVAMKTLSAIWDRHHQKSKGKLSQKKMRKIIDNHTYKPKSLPAKKAGRKGK